MSNETNPSPADRPPDGAAGTLIQSPELNSKGVADQHSVKDAGMAADIVKTVIAANRNRAIVNSRILAKYNAERPYDAYKLEAEGLGWRSNFTTKPLPSMIDKVAPVFKTVIDGLKYFTDSALSDNWVSAVEKTEKFRAGITKTIRGRKGFNTLIEDICFDNALFGHAVPALLDEFSWWPKCFKQDEAFVSDGTKSDARWAQVVVLKETFLPHELFALVKDREAAKTAGWNLEETYKAINDASPAQLRPMLNVGGTMETWYQNACRELTIGASYMAGNSVIAVYSLLAREVNGKVSHYRLAGDQMKMIFSREDRFPSMEDCLVFFTFQKGNGTVYGSKGIGRDIYELAGMIDRCRNEVVDRLIMSGKTIVQGDVRRIHTFKMSVIGSTVIMPSNWDILERKMDGNVDGFIKLDMFFNQLVNELIGSVSTPTPGAGGEDMRSPAAWNLLAQRQEASQDVRISRFMTQFVDLVSLMQKRLCDTNTTEDDAKQFQKDMLEHMTREELDYLAAQPVAGTVKDLTPIERQMVVAISQEKKGNPYYNGRQLEVEDMTARVGTDFANRVILPDNDPTVQAEQTRMQEIEIVLLSSGQPVPVSPRDNHIIHLGVVMPAVEQLAQQITQGQNGTPVLEAFVAHINEHYSQATKQGVPQKDLAEVKAFLDKAGPMLAQLKQVDQGAEQLEQAHGKFAAGAPPDQVQIPQVPPPPGQ